MDRLSLDASRTRAPGPPPRGCCTSFAYLGPGITAAATGNGGLMQFDSFGMALLVAAHRW